MLRLEGRALYSDSLCQSCGMQEPRYRCEDCLGQVLHCSKCVLATHALHPLHMIKMWNGDFFEPVSLKSLGLHVQLGHLPGHPCHNPDPCFDDDFTVIDTTGIHSVSLNFCNCGHAPSQFQQLLRFAWFPATTLRPRTAATFRVLELFHMLSLESKISGYEFYSSLSRLVNNTGLVDIKNRYETFLRISREWRHLKMLKRMGRAYDPHGIAATRDGQCAILCPACPHPGKNLPPNFRNAGEENQWLYAQFVAIDANFRLKRKKVSKDSVDPSLSKGWAYFVEESAYKTYLSNLPKIPQERSTCSSHLAVNKADTLTSHGLAATGVGTIDCARHNMKLPTAVGDLQKGERYTNMDYLFFSAMRHSSVTVLNVSYDIACQWSKHIWDRMAKLPADLHLDFKKRDITFFVPKFHLPAHVQACQTMFSFNFIPGVGRTDGEAPERGWSNINPAAASTKEMGPGARRDVLDDHFGHWNWKKVAGLRGGLLEKLKVAIPKRAELQDALKELKESIAVDHASSLVEWAKQVLDWEGDQRKPNPYEYKGGGGLTLAAVRLELAKEDTDDLLRGIVVNVHNDCTVNVLISTGLELEDLQRRLRYEKAVKGLHMTDSQEAWLTERCNSLQRQLDHWIKLQQLFFPMLATERAKQLVDADTIVLPESFDLLLPSKIVAKLPCDDKTFRIEWRLRLAQAHDALNSLRSNLRARSYICKFKDRNLCGQGANTRARTTLHAIENRINAAANRYNDARNALENLASHLKETSWRSVLRPLHRQDIRGMSDLLWGETEGTRKLSWIWSMRGSVNDNRDEAGALEDLRIEWCKARARAHRWAEEVKLLLEEMWRTVVFFEWDATDWNTRGVEFTSDDPALLEGFRAYAQRQAALRRALATSCCMSWAETIATATS
ncbi:hypothetical protein EV363DRAFT_1165737 [Boletus edulis]|nr:hypothetical protein EV363DRAFT_1165737 [Boletus edulis]